MEIASVGGRGDSGSGGNIKIRRNRTKIIKPNITTFIAVSETKGEIGGGINVSRRNSSEIEIFALPFEDISVNSETRTREGGRTIPRRDSDRTSRRINSVD